MTRRTFLLGFLIGLLIFLLINVLAAHLLSDCGLAAVFGHDFCADDIARAGFPLIFYEDGGFAYRHIFSPQYLYFDIFIGLGLSIALGFVFHWWLNRHPANPS